MMLCSQIESGDTAANADNVSLSAEINELTSRLRDASQQQQQQQHAAVVTSPQDVSSDLIRTSLSVLKLEKQTRLQKVCVICVSMLCNGQLNAFLNVLYYHRIAQNRRAGFVIDLTRVQR